MQTSSPTPDARARRVVSVVMQRLHGDANQTAVAAAMGVSPSTVSRLVTEHLDKLALLLVHLGLKVVPVEAKTVDPERAEALGKMLAVALRKQRSPADLLFDSESDD